MAKVIFDDLKSHFHAIVGFISAFTLQYSLIILFIYIFYQRRENEAGIFTIGDLVEFLVGYVYGLAVFVWWLVLKAQWWW